jgi:urease accessory protein
MPTGALALLADGRFPSGGHAHSAGWEAAQKLLQLDDTAALRRFIDGRLATVGLTEAAFVAAIIQRLDASVSIAWAEVDAEVDARIASPIARRTSRSLGRQWVRAARSIWRGEPLTLPASDGDPHQIAAFACVAAHVGTTPEDAVRLHLHHLVATITTAAVRLQGFDPFAIQRLQFDLLESTDRVVDDALSWQRAPWSELPASSGPLADQLIEHHATWDLRLFQS